MSYFSASTECRVADEPSRSRSLSAAAEVVAESCSLIGRAPAFLGRALLSGAQVIDATYLGQNHAAAASGSS